MSAKKRGLTELLVDMKKKKKNGLKMADFVGEDILSMAEEQGAKLGNENGSFMKTVSSEPLMNKKFLETKATVGEPHKECDPKQATESATADVGILGCGDHQYCMESKYSKLGGFCVMDDDNKAWHMDQESHRMLQMNGTNPCDTTFTATGFSVSCPDLASLCVQPCNTTCFSLSSYFYRSFDGSLSYNDLCTDVTEPFVTRFCYGEYTVGDQDPVCTASYAGQDCACFNYDLPNNQTCTVFDCTNVQGYYGNGTAGNTCYFDQRPPPLWSDSLFDCLEYCDPCSGGTITDYYAIIPALNISCNYASYFSNYQPIPAEYCEVLQITAFEACGCEGGNPPFICSACPGGGMISNPDTVVDLSAFDLGNATCAEIELYAPLATAYYGIDATTCPFFQGLIVEPCGCTVPMTPAPVDPMTPAPMAAMTPAPMMATDPVADPTEAPAAAPTDAPPVADPTEAPAATPTDAPTSGASSILPLALAGLSIAVASFFSG